MINSLERETYGGKIQEGGARGKKRMITIKKSGSRSIFYISSFYGE